MDENSTSKTDKKTFLIDFLKLCALASQRPLDAAEVARVNEICGAVASLDRTLGSEYAALEPLRIVTRLEIGDHHLQPWGITNGGIYASLGETAGSMASYIAAGAKPPVVGTSNETHFLRPSGAGDVILSTATPENVGRTSHLWRVEHHNEKTGKLCALTFLRTQVMPDMLPQGQD